MSQRTLMIVALAAAFTLVLIGGVVSRVSVPPEPSGAPVIAPPAVPSVEAPVSPDPGVLARYQELEQQLRARIEEANRRLLRQQAALDEARRQLEQPAPARRAIDHERDDDDEHDDDEHDDDEHDDDEHRHDRFAHADRHAEHDDD